MNIILKGNNGLCPLSSVGSEHQATNLGVGSSSLSGGANPNDERDMVIEAWYG